MKKLTLYLTLAAATWYAACMVACYDPYASGDPRLRVPEHYQIQQTYTVCDDAGTKDAGCETLQSIIDDYTPSSDLGTHSLTPKR